MSPSGPRQGRQTRYCALFSGPLAGQLESRREVLATHSPKRAPAPGATNRPHPKAEEERKRAATALARQPARPRLAPRFAAENRPPAGRVAAAAAPAAPAYR
jgi:hypothetical protein